jgi:hypothetical protein
VETEGEEVMIKVWVLIWALDIYQGGGPTIERFYSQEACQSVLNQIQVMDNRIFDASSTVACVEIEEPAHD